MAQNVSIAGADYPAVPYLLIPITGGGGTNAKFVDTSGATATASGDVVLGKTAYGSAGTLLNGSYAPTITGNYTANTKTLAISTANTTAAWFGGLNCEFLYEGRWSAKLNQAANWPLTPTTAAQALTWTTSITTTAATNATFDRYGNGYHGVTATLDFGTYNYLWVEDAYIKYVYSSDESALGKVHVYQSGTEAVYHWGARPRSASGAIVYPTASTYGSYANCTSSSALCMYRNASNVMALANNCTYGISLAAIAPSMSSTSSVKPNYFNLRIPSFGIRAHDTYMAISAYSDLDASKTELAARIRIYRMPAADGLYTLINQRIIDMMGNCAFPAEPI